PVKAWSAFQAIPGLFAKLLLRPGSPFQRMIRADPRGTSSSSLSCTWRSSGMKRWILVLTVVVAGAVSLAHADYVKIMINVGGSPERRPATQPGTPPPGGGGEFGVPGGGGSGAAGLGGPGG